MQIHKVADRKLATTLHRKPTDCAALLHFHFNHSVKSKESIVFSQALRYSLLIADHTIQKKRTWLPEVSLLARKCPLEIITRKISKALLHSRDILGHRIPRASSSRIVLPTVTPCWLEEKQFSKSVRDNWLFIEKNPQLHSIWLTPSHSLYSPITPYHKTESIKDILVHSRQAAKSLSLRSAPNKYSHQ